MGAAASRTVTQRPAAKPETSEPRVKRTVDLAEFQRAIVAIGLIDADELERFVVTPDEVSRLAGALIRAGKLTAYQAAALAQGKARGLVLGEYLVLDKLGQGGMGVVFKARHRPSGEVVALKVLPPSFGRDQSAVDRFRREVEIAGRLDHPNVVAALDTGQVQGVHFLTTEYISGYDLDRLVAEGGPLPVDLALHCTIHAARGLASAHAQGIIHRDVKPANVMLDENGSVRVLDLGLARVVEAGNQIGATVVGSLTQSGAYMGTVDFMAPEQADDPRKVDHRADIYSLGCTLYFLLVGRPPFLADTVLKRLMAHQERSAPLLRSARPEVPEKLEDVYLQMMAKRLADRPDSMADVIDLLEACRSAPENEEEARSDLTIFARRAFKRAVPRGRDRGPDASIFARRAEIEGLQFDPDLRFEDVVTDLRKEVHTEPLSEEKLPPIVSRPLPKRVRHRRSAVPYGWIGFALFGLAALVYALRSGSGRQEPESPGTAGAHLASAAPSASSAPDTVVANSATLVAKPTASSPPALIPATKPARIPPAGPARGARGVAGDSWRVEGNVLIKDRKGPGWVHFGDPNWTDYDLTFEMRTSSGDPAGSRTASTQPALGANVRVSSAPDPRVYGIIFGQREYVLLHWSKSRGNVGLQWMPKTLPLHQWHKVKVSLRGTQIRADLDGQLVFSRDDDYCPRGIVSLATWGASDGQFRNIRVSAPDGTALWEGPPDLDEADSSFRPLFNGRDLSGWAGAVGDYQVVGGTLSSKPGRRQPAIYEPVERRDFAARVEFRLAPGAEGGMEIRYPGSGHGGFTSMCEIQILDDSHPSYAKIDPRLYNGSAWGIAAARRGHLLPLGEWNVQQVTVRGSTVKVELNGAEILNTDLATIHEFGGGQPHPGKDRTSGYFGIQCGPGTNQGGVEFRKIEIRDLPAAGTDHQSASSR
jgi:serine/threonine protein kinase